MDIKLVRGQVLRHFTNKLETAENVIITMPDGVVVQVSQFQGAWEVWQVPPEGHSPIDKVCCMASSNHIPDKHFDE